MKFIPVELHEEPHGILGILLIFTVICVLYSIISSKINNKKIAKLYKAKELIEEGHERKEREKFFEQDFFKEEEVEIDDGKIEIFRK